MRLVARQYVEESPAEVEQLWHFPAGVNECFAFFEAFLSLALRVRSSRVFFRAVFAMCKEITELTEFSLTFLF